MKESVLNAVGLQAWLIQRVAEVSGKSADLIEPDEPFFSYGLDSVKLAALAQELEQKLSQSLDASLLFEYPSPALLASHLMSGKAGKAAQEGGQSGESIAIIGIACRMPGAGDAEDFWRMLQAGTDAIREVPPDRWDIAAHYDANPEVAGRSVSKWGGFLEDVTSFDARFFRIPPEEALRMDPQQRLLLELCWEALEDAGKVPAQLRVSSTGVYVGISVNDYAHRQLQQRHTIDRYMASGGSLAVAANRVSYLFDFQGPSISVDTACSSSLVATHLACRALRSRECDLALVGGVNLLLDPEITISLSKAGMLSPDGRCKPFDSRANGYVRGEGCGVVVLKPLSAAVASGDRVYSVIRGSAINQDGRSNGLTAPNPASQRAVVQAACRDAGAVPSAIRYVECHGTGTLLGDQIEARSLGAVVGAGSLESSCLLGSVKSNIGHLEAAAGIAGLIKLALSMHHGVVPPSIHFAQPNPQIPFAELGLKVATEAVPWRSLGRGAIAGISSFGFGGTNAHMILETPPPAAAVTNPRWPIVLPVSARSRASLNRALESWAARVGPAAPEDLAGIGYTASACRTHHRPFRLAFVGDDPQLLAERLRDAAKNVTRLQELRASVPRFAFVFSGQGSQWAGMGRELLDTDSLFRSVIRRCDSVLAEETGWSIEAVLRGQNGLSLDDSAVAQPSQVALQLALVQVWRAMGIEPSVVAGHSLGEIPAAVTAGLLDFDNGLRLAARRGKCMGEVQQGQGRMLALGIGRREAEELCNKYAEGIQLAAINSPVSTVVAGNPNLLKEVYEEMSSRGVLARWLQVEYAFHSRQMQPAADLLVAKIGELSVADPVLPFYSTVLARKISGSDVDANYWARGITQPVDFAGAINAMLRESHVEEAGGGVDIILEVGPQPVLHGPLVQLAQAAGQAGIAILRSLESGHSDRRVMFDTLAQVYALGSQVRWEYLYLEGGKIVSTPSHPWEHERFWIEREQPVATESFEKRNFLGRQLDLAVADGRMVWETVLGSQAWPCIADHEVGGAVLLPATAYIELALAAGEKAGLGTRLELRNLVLHRALHVEPGPLLAQTTLAQTAESVYSFSVHSQTNGAWVLHATGELRAGSAERPETTINTAAQHSWEQIAPAVLYSKLKSQGLNYGSTFRGLQAVRAGNEDAVAEIAVPVDKLSPGTERLRLLDCAFQLIGAVAGLRAGATEGGPTVPVGLAALHAWSHVGTRGKAHVRVHSQERQHFLADITILDEQGTPCIEIVGLELRRSAPKAAASSHPKAAAPLRFYETLWREREPEFAANSGRIRAGRWLVLEDDGGMGSRLAAHLAGQGISVISCKAAESYKPPSANKASIDPWQPAHYQRLLHEIIQDAEPLAGVVHLWGCDFQSQTSAMNSTGLSLPSVSVLNLVRALSFSAGSSQPRLLVATRGCQPVADSDVTDPVPATIWGLLKTLPIENPLLSFSCIDLEADEQDPTMVLFTEMLAEARDIEIGYRRGRRLVRRVAEVPGEIALGRQCSRLALRADASYVISGGTGALGLLVAHHLVERGARHVVLLARQPGSAGSKPALQKLRNSTVDLRIVAADVSDREHLAGVLAELRVGGPPIRGIVHAAGVLDDGAFLDMSPESLRAVLEPKVLGGWNLHELTQQDPIDWFALFSSAAGVLGSPGQANYSAANACLDALAHYRRHLGLPAVSIDWGPWAEAGMAAEMVESGEGRRLRTAASAISPSDGLAAFEYLMCENRVQTMVLPFDLRDLLQFYPAGVGLSFFDEISTEEVAALKSIGVRSSVRPDLEREYVGPRNAIERQIVGIWQKSLAIEPIGVFDSFFELGGDSVFGNQILVEINRSLGVSIDSERAFQKLTVAHLAELAEEQVIAQLNKMTDQDAERMIKEMQGASNPVSQ